MAPLSLTLPRKGGGNAACLWMLFGRSREGGVVGNYPVFPTRYPAAGCFASSLARPAPNSFSRSVPANAISTTPGAAAVGPSSQPPTYSPPIQIDGTEERPVSRPSSARRALPMASNSRSTVFGSSPASLSSLTAFLHDGEVGHWRNGHGAARQQ